MREKIDGKVYDTETATVLGDWRKPHSSRRDFSYCEETLYITREGLHFLHGRGGGASAWATHTPDGNSLGWGEAIEPMTIMEAMQWIEAHLT